MMPNYLTNNQNVPNLHRKCTFDIFGWSDMYKTTPVQKFVFLFSFEFQIEKGYKMIKHKETP